MTRKFDIGKTRCLMFKVPGMPQGKGRHKTRVIQPKAGGRAFATQYTPKETRNYEGTVKSLAMDAMERGGLDRAILGPLLIELEILIPPPASWPEWKRAAALEGWIIPESKPDGDNVLKAIQDALNEWVYRDDKQIADSVIIKRYAESPSVTASLYRLHAAGSTITSKSEFLALKCRLERDQEAA